MPHGIHRDILCENFTSPERSSHGTRHALSRLASLRSLPFFLFLLLDREGDVDRLGELRRRRGLRVCGSRERERADERGRRGGQADPGHVVPPTRIG